MPKTLISIRLDNELVDWFRQNYTEGYQTQMNRVLQSYRAERQSKKLWILGRAQQIYQQFHARCFWHLDRELRITESLLPLVQSGLRKYGGREGYLLAAELELEKE